MGMRCFVSAALVPGVEGLVRELAGLTELLADLSADLSAELMGEGTLHYRRLCRCH